MIEALMALGSWLLSNPSVIGAMIGAIPALFAALWARSARKETRPNDNHDSLRDIVDQIAERQLVLMRSGQQEREKIDYTVAEQKSMKEEMKTDRRLLYELAGVIEAELDVSLSPQK